ncbi:hypothetical protein RJ640_006393 [Escallonia rubra]|uniref:J domain-containing protein n=1 Tax=Escallonia rubra TaxID=112253 RepID=A0AA88RNV2_9ASTE|nr:hypothetical protein RJ640_006393 [Escallonia rubra]
MALLGKRCQYKVLGLGGDCTADKIRSAYRRLALQRHPDKLAQFGVSPITFQELATAYKGHNGASFGPIEMHLDELRAVDQSAPRFKTSAVQSGCRIDELRRISSAV